MPDALTRPPISLLPVQAPETPSGLFIYQAAIGQAADRIDEWVPKGVHFGWEKSFRNKSKFAATMNKSEARDLVARLLRGGRQATHYPDARPQGAERLRVVVDAGRAIGTRGQRRVRIVLVRDAAGFKVENAFPVHER